MSDAAASVLIPWTNFYRHDFEDWTWYSILPLFAYVAVLAGGIGLFRVPASAMFAVAAGALLFVFIGIHNAWDIVTFLAIGNRDDVSN